MKQYLAFDIGGTFIKYALMGEDGSFLENGKTPTPADSLDHLLDAMTEIGAQFEGRFEGVAVSMPGRIDTATGIAHTGGALMYIDATPMGQLLEERLHKPVRLANDAKCAANAEVWSGALAEFGEMTAAGIYGVQSVLDLGRFAIGGGISARPEVTDIIRTKLDAIYAAVPFTAFGKPEIVRCRYGNDANLIGALRFLLSSI